MFAVSILSVEVSIYHIILKVNNYLYLIRIIITLQSEIIMIYFHQQKEVVILKCYIDTMSVYINLNTTPVVNNAYATWRFFKSKIKDDNHFFIRYKRITCRYYPNRYGVGQIWLTFSVPKLLRGNNLFPITGQNIDMQLYGAVNRVLAEIFDMNTMPTCDISSWEVSRADLFFLHKIEPRLRKWYLRAYERLTLGAYTPYKYMNTYYLNSTLKKHKGAGTVVRIYPKLQEMQDTMPVDVRKDFEEYMMLNDELQDYIRFEFQFRRQTLRYFFNRRSSVTVADVMQEQFQKERINRMIVRLGLNKKIISRKNMQQQIDKIFIKQPTRQRVRRYITLVNARGTYQQTIKQQFAEGQIKYIKQKLNEHDLHTVVSDFEDLEPVQLLK